MTRKENTENTCCLKIDPAVWQDKTHEWQDKLFVMESVPELFHFPIPVMVRKAITRMWAKAEKAGAAPDLRDFLMLAYDPSPWKGNIYISVTKEVPEAKNVKFTGTFVSKVFDGPIKDVPKYIKETDSYLKSNNQIARKHYFYFTSCPKCAKKFGHNYIISLAEIA